MHLVTTPINVGSQTVTVQSVTNVNIGLITGVATAAVLVVIIIVLTLIAVGAITICRRNQHQTKVPTVSNEAYGTVLKNLAVHINLRLYTPYYGSTSHGLHQHYTK